MAGLRELNVADRILSHTSKMTGTSRGQYQSAGTVKRGVSMGEWAGAPNHGQPLLQLHLPRWCGSLPTPRLCPCLLVLHAELGRAGSMTGSRSRSFTSALGLVSGVPVASAAAAAAACVGVAQAMWACAALSA